MTVRLYSILLTNTIEYPILIVVVYHDQSPKRADAPSLSRPRATASALTVTTGYHRFSLLFIFHFHLSHLLLKKLPATPRSRD